MVDVGDPLSASLPSILHEKILFILFCGFFDVFLGFGFLGFWVYREASALRSRPATKTGVEGREKRIWLRGRERVDHSGSHPGSPG
jgi:hypothetical protein